MGRELGQRAGSHPVLPATPSGPQLAACAYRGTVEPWNRTRGARARVAFPWAASGAKPVCGWLESWPAAPREAIRPVQLVWPLEIPVVGMIRCILMGWLPAALLAAVAGEVPGTVICHSPLASGRYIGSPSLTVLPNGELIASHDFFGPKSNERTCGISRVYASRDGGAAWELRSEVDRASHSRVFEHNGDLYLFAGKCYRKSRFRHMPGTLRSALLTVGYKDNPPNQLLIRRSSDGGRTWTSPTDSTHGLLKTGRGGGAPTPPVRFANKLWLAAGALCSVDQTADLLDAASWSYQPKPRFRKDEWLGGKAEGYFEGGAVITPKGEPAIISKVRYFVPGEDRAALVTFGSRQGAGSFDPEQDFIPMPGARLKFSVRHDPVSRRYWSLTSYLPEEDYGTRTDLRRNTIALVSSPDLRTWTVQCILLHHPDTDKHGLQYLDFLFAGPDLIAVCRTAWPDGAGGPKRQHDANYLTFHRWRDFRKLTLSDSCLEARARLSKTLAKLRQQGAQSDP